MFDQFVGCHALDADSGSIEGDLYVSGRDTGLIAEGFRNYQSPCLIYGSSHTTDATIQLASSRKVRTRVTEPAEAYIGLIHPTWTVVRLLLVLCVSSACCAAAEEACVVLRRSCDFSRLMTNRGSFELRLCVLSHDVTTTICLALVTNVRSVESSVGPVVRCRQRRLLPGVDDLSAGTRELASTARRQGCAP